MVFNFWIGLVKALTSIRLNTCGIFWTARFEKEGRLATSKQELIRILQEEWVSIDLETLRGLILSLSRRVDKVIEANDKARYINL